jgi:hypothetical protein
MVTRSDELQNLGNWTSTDEAPSAQLDLDLGDEYLVLLGYFSAGEFMETSRERPLSDAT